jgi:hypothetical protein
MNHFIIAVLYTTGQLEQVELSALDDDDAMARLGGYIAPQTMDDVVEARIVMSTMVH